MFSALVASAQDDCYDHGTSSQAMSSAPGAFSQAMPSDPGSMTEAMLSARSLLQVLLASLTGYIECICQCDGQHTPTSWVRSPKRSYRTGLLTSMFLSFNSVRVARF